MGEASSTYSDAKKNVRMSVRKAAQVKRPLRRSRCRWEDNIMNIKDTGRKRADWIHLAQTVVTTVIHFPVP
jgi:hypothetical protein